MSWIKHPLLQLLICLFLFPSATWAQIRAFSIKEVNQTDLLEPINFFMQSNRRDLSDKEERLIVRATKKGKESGCSAFFLKNTQGKIYVGTARHCYSHKEEQACNNDEIRILPSGTLKNFFLGTCKRLVAGSIKDDFFIMEVNILDSTGAPASQELTSQIQKYYVPLVLTSYAPPAYFPLKMLGYPSDDVRKSRPTVSENCYVQPDNTKTAIQAVPEDQRDPRYLKWLNEKRPLDPETKSLEIRHRAMNCSVYGGNSGGPIIIENSYDLLGLPSSYAPGLYNKIPESYSVAFEEIKSFVDRNLSQIQDNGLVISSRPTFQDANFDYLDNLDPAKVYLQSPDSACGYKLLVNKKEGILISQTVSISPKNCAKNGEILEWFCSPSLKRKFCTNRKESDKDTFWFIHKITDQGFSVMGSDKIQTEFTAFDLP